MLARSISGPEKLGNYFLVFESAPLRPCWQQASKISLNFQFLLTGRLPKTRQFSEKRKLEA
jgi:hypothetical protein